MTLTLKGSEPSGSYPYFDPPEPTPAVLVFDVPYQPPWSATPILYQVDVGLRLLPTTATFTTVRGLANAPAIHATKGNENWEVGVLNAVLHV